MKSRILLFVFSTLMVDASYAQSGEWSGNISLDMRLFPQSADFDRQKDQSASFSFEPEYYLDWADGDQRLVVNPFFRYDSADDERSHIDLREFYWRISFTDMDVKIGVAKVFWGVAESQHLVDVINQTDLIENIDTEDKLGQPMLNLNLVKDWGTTEFYILPYFRERTFPGEEGRLRAALAVDTDEALYEHDDEEGHVDFAIRWSHYIGDWDIGISHFSGTSREPDLIPSFKNGALVLFPYYQQIDQTGLDLQATMGNWLWKLEAISRSNGDGRYSAAIVGFEYTIVGLLGTSKDLGVLLEYHFDDRGDEASAEFENDLFTGVRWVFNDIQSTEILAGVIVDADTHAVFGNIEASRRFGQSWKLSLEGRIISNMDSNSILYELRNEDYVELKIAKYF